MSLPSAALQIRTPEGIVFSYSLAGPVTRCLAWLIDCLIVIGLQIALLFSLGKFGMLARELIGALLIVGYFGLSIGYGIVLETAWRGQTVGKRAMRLRVMDAQGLRLRFHQVLLRNLLRAVDSLPAFYLVGGATSVLNRRVQRLGDLAAGTVVVHIPTHSEPDLEQLLVGKYNSLRGYPHLAARLRQRATPEQARLALQAIVRRDELEPTSRVALFSEIAAHFRALVPFPDEAVESVPDEQYVRNVVDVLFRAQQESVRAQAVG